MITINNLKELKPYYNSKNNTYDFYDNVRFVFDLKIESNLNAYDIDASNINARNIDASNINAHDIDAWNTIAFNIKANDINASDIKANGIDANDISFYAICFARKTFVCNSIVSRRTNSKYFCLDSEVVIKGETK